MAQDTIRYYQENAQLFANYYHLYPQSKTFEHWFTIDDGQTWYGKGNYKQKNTALVFSFEDFRISHSIQSDFFYSKTTTDTVEIHIYNEGFKVDFFTIGDQFFLTNYDGWTKVSKTCLVNARFISFHPIIEDKIALENQKLSLLKKIKVSLNIPPKLVGKLHIENNFKRVVKMKKNHFISDDYYHNSRKKKIKFIKR